MTASVWSICQGEALWPGPIAEGQSLNPNGTVGHVTAKCSATLVTAGNDYQEVNLCKGEGE